MNVLVYDIETLTEMFLVGVFLPKENKYVDFEVSKSRYQLTELIEFIDQHLDFYWVGYNNLRFDIQIVEWIYRNYKDWEHLTNLEIAAKIAQKAQDVIHDANFDVFAEYREENLTIKQIDPFKINHYDNKNRRVSLKRLEFEMDMENIEEMPIYFKKPNLTLAERKVIREYCKNDVMATHEFYKITTGNTDHPLYKENDQIQLRLDIESEFGIFCMNYSDSKIGDEIIKKYYCEEKKLDPLKLPKKGTFRKSIQLKNCIAPYVKFHTVQLINFLKYLKSKSLLMNQEFKESIKYYDMVYSFMQGGLHSENKPEIIEADDDYLLIDWDVSSYYPAIIINNNKYPYHLGKEFLVGYKKMFEKRLVMKPFAKTDKRVKGIVNALKLAVNAAYGKSSDITSWLYDRELTMFTTITGQLSLMMLIEKYEMKNIKIVSANTDGVTVRIHKDDLEKMYAINDWWCKLTGYELERSDYSKIIFSTVNDYIAIYTSGEIKKKGDFLTDFELHKNKSGRVIPIALEKWFVHGISVEESIKNHTNIYDFGIRKKATRDFHYEGFKIDKKEKTIYNKLIRYYVSNSGEKIYKIKNPECQTNAAAMSQVEAGEWLATVCNYLPKTVKPSDVDINYDYYIEKAQNILMKIKTGKKYKKNIIISNQMKLF